MSTKTKLIVSIVLISLGVVTRLLPHWWNFTPLAAIALFSGVYLGQRYAVGLPVVTMLLSDLVIGFYEWQLMLAVYGSFILVGVIGMMVKKHKNVETVLASSIVASVLFYLITNFAVWQFSFWYAKNLTGLAQSYIAALPFFRSSLLGDLFYVTLLFGIYEVILRLNLAKIYHSQQKVMIKSDCG